MQPFILKLLTLFSASAAACCWIPEAGMTWEIILSKIFEDVEADTPLPDVQVLDGDLFDNSAESWADIKSRGYKTICYFSAGSYEEWRDDAYRFDEECPEAKGSPLDDWEGETWIDTRSECVRNIMIDRIAEAKAKGCDAIDPDNLDAYLREDGGGFSLTLEDGIDYVHFISAEAHNRNISVGLKNGDAMVDQVLDLVDFEVNEQCQEYENTEVDPPYYECSIFEPFIRANKPVFRIEYFDTTTESEEDICNYPYAQGFSTLIKYMNLDERTTRCSV